MECPNNKPIAEDQENIIEEKSLNQQKNVKSNSLDLESRVHKPVKQSSNSDADYVNIVAILRRTLRSDCFVLIKQFRTNLNVETLEFPQGCICEGELPEYAALKMLKEITGYNGVVKQVGAVVAFEPSLSKNTMKYVTVEIDGDNSNNSNPVIKSNKDGDFTVVQICVDEILPKLCEYSRNGILIDSRLQAFSLGLAMGAPKKYQLKPAESVDEK